MSAILYNVTQATRHPAIWMGERGSIAIVPGGALEGNVAKIEQFLNRGLPLDSHFEGSKRGNESTSYTIELFDS